MKNKIENGVFIRPTLYVMCGIQGSGKSTFANVLEEESGAIRLSSDEIRLELFGSESSQSNNRKVFKLLYDRARFHLNQGEDVIIDAMNITEKGRMSILNEELDGIDCTTVILFMDTPLKQCILNDKNRERTLGPMILTNTFKRLQSPKNEEGWHYVSTLSWGDISETA